MKRKIYIALGVLLPSIFCSLYLYSCFAPPTNTPCMPIGYPNGDKLNVDSTKIYTFETIDAYSDVIDFYRTNLKFDAPVIVYDEEIQWVEYPIRDIGVLFQCGSKLNGYELELGCIFVHKRNEKSVVDITWSFSEGTAVPCDVLPNIEPDDY